ncbi:dynein heavy chain domain-containing protein 1 [Pholidichthys leucotaenia]
MSAAISKEAYPDGLSPTCGKDGTKPGGKAKKKTQCAEVTFPPLCPKPSCLSAASAARSLFSGASVLKNVPSERPLSVAELPHLIAEVGPRKVSGDRKWMERPQLMTSAKGAEILLTNAESSLLSLTNKNESLKATMCKDRMEMTIKDGQTPKPTTFPLTGIEVVQFFIQKRKPRDLKLYFLKEVEGDAYRPYDLRVVHSSEAGPEHYVFSCNTVLHVTETGYGERVSLAEWYREYMLWTALQKIPFFRDFRLHKAFTWWHKTTRSILFQRRCNNLQDKLLIAVPQFRNALYLFTSVIEELKGTHWMPLEDCKSYTFLEIVNVLKTNNQDLLLILKKLSQYHNVVLNMVKEDSYEKHQQLQLRIKLAKKQNRCHQPIHLLLANQRDLKKELALSESILRKLGNFASLVHQMIVQSLVTVIKEDAISFLNGLKRRKSKQGGLFHTELCLSANNQLILEPPLHLFKQTVSEALLTAGRSVIQMCDSCGFFLEISDDVFNTAQDLTLDRNCMKPSTTTGEENNYGRPNQFLQDMTARWLVHQKSFEMVQGSTVQGCFYPLSRAQLEWQISINDITRQVEKEQAKITQEAELEVHQLCENHSWLVDIQLFINQWSPASLESMKGQPASMYEEHIKRVRGWAERINKVYSAVTTSNQLFTIHCTNTKETLGWQLRLIEKEVQDHLDEQLKSLSDSLISDLEKTTAELKAEPQDLEDLSKYAVMVRDCLKQLPDRYKHLEYIHSLQKTVCVNYRMVTEQEVVLDQKMLDLWRCFIFMMKQANSQVHQHLPSAVKALDTMFSFLVLDLKNVASDATSGNFLDPTQDAKEMASRLNYMCEHINTLCAKLEQLSRTNQRIQEHAMDLTILTTDIRKTIARKDLWELMATYTSWLEEWKQLLFSEVVVSEAQKKIMNWEEQAKSLTDIPPHDAVLRNVLGNLESLSRQLAIMAKLQSPRLKHKHWSTVLQGLEMQFSKIENDLMTLSTMLKSPYSVELRLQLTDWIQRLKELEKLLDIFEKFQQLWTFLTKMCGETFPIQSYNLVNVFQPVDKSFREVIQYISTDPHILKFISNDTKNKFHGASLYQLLFDGYLTMEVISNQMMEFRDLLCEKCPRLYFLSDREVMKLLSIQSTPSTLQPFVQKLFKGICYLDVESELPSNTGALNYSECTSENHSQRKVLGFFGSLDEHIVFRSSLEPNPNALVWLHLLEKQLKLTVLQLMIQCAVERNQLEPLSQVFSCQKGVADNQLRNTQPILDLLSKYPLQCLLVTEDAAWCTVVQNTFQEQSPVKLSDIMKQNSTKLKSLGHLIRNAIMQPKSESLASKYTMMCLRALMQLIMNHAQQLSRLMEVPSVQESSFEWLSLLKYHINSCVEGSDDPTCYADIFFHRFQYGFEYSGPEDLVIVHTPSTDRAMLGILLALTSYRCGCVSGPSMSEKSTVIQLGKALGCQIVTIQCYPNFRADDVQRMLLGALQTEAWLLFDCVDFLSQGVLSMLGQHVEDIHQYFSKLRRKKNQRMNGDPEDKTANSVTDCRDNADPECQMVFAGKSLSPSLNYGCFVFPSKSYTSEIPEILRFATRPIALLHPDYKIMTEVMLTSAGFSDAVSLSHRLVSLISLSKESQCLSEFLTDDQSCFLGVLQKIISASEIHLKETVRKWGKADETKAANHSVLTSQQDTPIQHFEDKKVPEQHSKLHSSHLSVIQSLMEETAIVKAIISVLIPELKKASHFYSIFKDAFPIVCQFPIFQHYIEDAEKIQLQNAIIEVLRQKQYCCDTEIIWSMLKLYRTIKFSHAVMLIGPSGSGKTTCYSTLAKALNKLAVKTVENLSENENIISINFPWEELQTSASSFDFVDTLVLFPNAMSQDELFGRFCDKRGWQDGAIAKVLKDLGRCEGYCSEGVDKKKTNESLIMKWLVMDGEPVGHPGWLDFLTTLCNSKNPFLCLPSGEMLLSASRFKLLMEITDIRDASPSTVTTCSLIYFTGIDMWKTVWKSELDALTFEHNLDSGIVNVWNNLGEDLFPRSFSLLEEKALMSAIHIEKESCKSSTYGLQELMSFVRILRALLHNFGSEVKKWESIPQINERGKDTSSQTLNRDVPGTNTAATDAQSKSGFLTRNLFLVAYIWGFGGHLHSCHWPQFEWIVRHVLFTSQYKIVIPDEESVFEHFFNVNSKMCPKNIPLTISVIPKYGKYTYLLKLMLEANQPVLLGGEPGTGKTTLCRALLSSDKPHINLPASPLLSSRELRAIMDSISCKNNRKDTMRSMTKPSGLVLFLDDLHEVPCDVFGKASMALETIRQSISKGEVLTFDTFNFKSLSCRSVSYMATCCVSEVGYPHRNVIPLRLLRLFSVFLLPGQSTDAILSIHSSWLKKWLRELSLEQKCEDISSCIITATKSLYCAVCDQFKPTMQKLHLLFSHHDLQKVFHGMCLWQPNIKNRGSIHKIENSHSRVSSVMSGPTVSLLNIIHLWMHECMRTFSDRLHSEDDVETVISLITKTAATCYGVMLADETHLDTEPISLNPDCQNICEEPKPADLPDLKKSHTSLDPTLVLEKNCSDNTNQINYTLHPHIFQHMGDTVKKLLYGPEISKLLGTLDKSQDFKCDYAYQAQDLDILVQVIHAFISRKEEDEGEKVDVLSKLTTRYIVHRQGVSHLSHILRALLTPGGHGLLIGSDNGTGRKTTVRLAAYLTGYKLIEIHSGNENMVHEILKEAGNQARMDRGNVIIMVHEEISLPVREELLVAMAQRAYPALYTEEELKNIVPGVTDVENSRRYTMDSWVLEKYLNNVYRNVHVFLLMPFTIPNDSTVPDKTETQRWTSQMAKALRLSCCVDVYQPWTKQSLEDGAAQCLKIIPHKISPESLDASLAVIMAGVHQSACQYASVLLRAQPFSPRTYMEFFTCFGHIYKCNKEVQDQKASIAEAQGRISELEEWNTEANEMLLKMLKQTNYMQDKMHEKEHLQVVDDQRKQFDEACEKCGVAEDARNHIEELNNIAQTQINPMHLLHLKILECLDWSDVEEVRHYRDPPDGVVKIMDVICLLFNRPPGWESAKQLLGQSNFFQELEFFDCLSLKTEQLQQLGMVVQSPQFVPESVRDISKACEPLCRWVQAVYECCCIQQQQLDKKQLRVQAREAQKQLQQAVQHREEAHIHLEEAKLQLQLVQKGLVEKLVQLHQTEDAEREASTCAEKMEMHNIKWKAAAQETELCKQNLTGDALIMAAIISYLGPFGPDIRTELLEKWRVLCQTGSININPEDPRTSLFTNGNTAPPPPSDGFPITVTERLQLPLGQALGMKEWELENTLSARLVVKLLLSLYRDTCDRRWPLLTNTQQHFEISSQNWIVTGEKATFEKETGCGMVICADDPELLNKLDQAAEKGLRVVVTHVERANPSPQFLAKLARSAGCCFSGCHEPPQLLHPDFCLILSTNLPVRLLSSGTHPSILALVHVVDLSLGSKEIEDLMLTQLLQSECQELLIQQLRYQNYNKMLQEKLVTVEEAFLDYILQSDTSLLQNSDLLPHVAVCQEELKNLQAEVKQLSGELEHTESLLAVPRHLVKLGAALYQALQAVSRLSPAYYFPLHGFITVMLDALTLKDRPLVSSPNVEVPGSIIPEVINCMVVKLLGHYRPRLFKSHAVVLKLLVSLALLQHNQLCSEAERLTFLRGFENIELPLTEEKVFLSSFNTALPWWIPPQIYPELFCLERIPHFRGLIASLCASPIQWQEYLRFPSSTVIGTVPCHSHSHLSLLQRALLWKTMVPDCLEVLGDAIEACQLCLSEKTAGMEAFHIGNMENFSQYIVKHKGPIILALPDPKEDTHISIQPLHLINQLAHCLADKEEIQVKLISFGVLCKRELILSMLDEALNDGHWLVFKDCHLLEQWDEKVVAYLNYLLYSFKEEPCLIHPCFRLWFITQENASHSVPVTVRMCSLILVCESQQDLKEELSFSLKQMELASQPQPQSCLSAENMDTLLRCAVFHSVLVQRQNYKHSSIGRNYHWSQEDLLALMDACVGIARVSHDRIKTMQYFAVNIVHGGHVMDSADLEGVESVAKMCFTTVSSHLGCGLHILSNIISNSDHYDLSKLLSILSEDLWDSANITEPAVLGFGVDVAADINKINSHNLNILLQASQTPVESVRGFSARMNQFAILPDYGHARDRLEALKSSLAHHNGNTAMNAGAVSHSPLSDFLQGEWDELIDLVSLLLSHLQQPAQYALTLTTLLKLADLSHLERRAELLSAYLWHHSTSDSPGVYRLAAFKNARGFLVALMRTAAYMNRRYISDITLHFQVLCDSSYPAPPPVDAVYLCGLELKGGSWDTQLQTIQDTVFPEPCLLPLLYVKAELPVYHCPLYLDKEQDSSWEMIDDNVITKVPLHTKLNPVLCSLRRVRLVSTL